MVWIRLHPQNLHLPNLRTLYNINQLPLIIFYCLIIYVKDVNLNLLLEKKHRNMYNFIKIDRQGLQLPFKFTQELTYIGYNIKDFI